MGLLGWFRSRVKWVEQAKIVPNVAQTEFGRAVAIDGDNLAIATLSAHLADGSNNIGTVQIYTCADKTWSYRETLFIPAEVLGNYSYFGSSLAINGNNLAIAADTLDRDTCNTPLFIFSFTGTNWQFATQLQLPSPPTTPIFYQSVAIDGDTVVAGTKGTVYVFRHQAATGTWHYETEFKSPRPDFYFGDTVAIDGDTIVVSGGDAGCAWAYVFVCNSATRTWSLPAELMPYEKSLGCTHAVAIADRTVAIGAPGENRQQGAVYIFALDFITNRWLPQARLVPDDVPPFYACGFGSSVAISDAKGDSLRDHRTIIIGTSTATLSDVSLPVWNRVTAYIFTRDRRTRKWLRSSQLHPQDDGVASTGGSVVAISAQQAIVATGDRSAVYVFQRLI